ncbi:MAG TPA: PAS domain S-box protein [Anaerolineaceae bacterium]|nr:PAS domain S-box protein [Anaerolineaceae bacterium]HPN51771.1 PAS domain S-box protein [Anaerolineaceae bacterium]
MAVFGALINNITLLITLSILYNFISRRWPYGTRTHQVLAGLLFGVVCLAGMLNPFVLSPGLIFDGRSIIISAAGMFGGPLTAIITAIIAGIYRALLGGAGMNMGLTVITVSAVIGILFHYLRRRDARFNGYFWVFLFGMLVHVAMWGAMLLVPSPLRGITFNQLTFPVLTIYPIGSFIVCTLFLDQERRLRAELELQRSDTRYQVLYRGMMDGFVQVNMEGKILASNQAFQEMLGYRGDELTRLTYMDLTPRKWHDMEERITREQIIPRGYSELYAKEYICKNGVILPAELRVYLNRDENGQPSSMWAAVRDISERDRATRALAESEERFRVLFEESPIALWECNFSELKKRLDDVKKQPAPDWQVYFEERLDLVRDWIKLIQITAANRAALALFGAASMEHLNGNLAHIFGYAFFISFFARLAALPESEAALESDAHGQTLNRQPVFVIVSANGLSAASPWQRVLISIMDITDRKRVEEEVQQYRLHLEDLVAARTRQLEAANKEMESFSYSVSHDLRAPLRSLEGFSQYLLEDYTAVLDEQGKGYLNRIRAASQRMNTLIDDLLKLARVSRLEFNSGPVDLAALARSVVTDLETSLPGQRVEFICPPELPATADASLMRIALVNLLNNAWKFTAQAAAPQVEFGKLEQDQKVIYFIRDNGAGFDMTYAGKLFGAFQRLHGSEFEGSGIGLAIVQRIIHRHGGEIWAEGEVGRGATFYFTLPPQP